MKSEIVRLQHEQAAMKERIKDNKEKIKMNKQLPYLVGNVVEVLDYIIYYEHGLNMFKILQLLDVDPEEDEEEGANIDLNNQRKGKCAVIKTSTRQVLLEQTSQSL
jgi:26S proteasome regulatory subunit T5